MSFECDGNILKCQSEFQTLKHKIEILEINKLDIKKWYGIKEEISNLKLAIDSIRENREEDRKVIDDISEKIESLEDKFTQILIKNTDILVSNAKIAERLEHVISLSTKVDSSVEKMDERLKKVEEKNIFDEIKFWMSKSKFNTFLGSFVIIMLGLVLISSAIFFLGGGVDLYTLVENVSHWFGDKIG